MRPDLKVHAKGGTLACAVFVALLLVAQHIHPALSVALCGPIFGWGVELYQKRRGESVPDPKDAVATAIPFWFAAAIWFAVA